MRLVTIASTIVLLAAGCSNERKLAAACEKGEPGACDVLSARYAYGDGVTKNEALSKQMASRAATLCLDAGPESAESCGRYTVKAVPLDLPVGRQAGSGEIPVVFTVVLAADGTTQVDGKVIPGDETVLPLARSAQEHNPELRAVIKADSAVPHGRVIHVLDLLKTAGVHKIAFGVSPLDRGIQAPSP